jgi:hypothetical protein
MALRTARSAAILRTDVQACPMNVICERLISTLRRELPDRGLIFGGAHLRTVLAEYQEHCNPARGRTRASASAPLSGILTPSMAQRQFSAPAGSAGNLS